jgi:hypothetical protein
VRRTRRLARAARRAAIGAGLLVAFGAGPLVAQERARSGFWMDAGAGYGRLRIRCANCATAGTAYGGTATVTFGRSLSRTVVLGLEAQVWSSWESGPREQVRSLSVVAQWYPFRERRFFVRGGTGLVQGPVVYAGGGAAPEDVKGTGVGLTVGVGYDVPLGKHFGLAVQLASHVAALGDLALAGDVTLDDTIAYVTRISVALVVR